MIFECCETRSVAGGIWGAVEVSWRSVDGDDTSDQSVTLKLRDLETGVDGCTGRLDCESYPGVVFGSDEAGKLPPGRPYWTRLLQLRDGNLRPAPEFKTRWQFLGLTTDEDGNKTIEVLVCGQLREHVPSESFWDAYTCDASATCNIASHPCCAAGTCDSIIGV